MNLKSLFSSSQFAEKFHFVYLPKKIIIKLHNEPTTDTQYPRNDDPNIHDDDEQRVLGAGTHNQAHAVHSKPDFKSQRNQKRVHYLHIHAYRGLLSVCPPLQIGLVV